MLIVLDSTVFWDDPNARSGAWALLREFARRSGSRAFVPDVVVDEVEANFGKRFDEALEESKNASLSLARLIDVKPDIPDPDRSQEMERYSRRLRLALKGLRVERLGYPSIPHPDLVKRQVNHQRPFQAKGTGYRDALIWHSLLDLLKDCREDCILVTKNSTDFSASKDSPAVIHSDLQKDLDAIGIKSKVTISKDLDAFLDEHGKPTLKKLDELKNDLENRKPIDLWDELQSRFRQIHEEINRKATQLLRIRRHDFRRLEEPIGISSMDEVPIELRIDDVLELTTHRVYLEFTGEYDAE